MKEIPLSSGRRGVALVDDEDYERIARHKWYRTHNGYAARAGLDRDILMHRQILGFPLSEHVDHVDGHGLNNQKANLRPCTGGQNQANRRTRRRFKGVTRRSGHKSIYAEIRVNGRRSHLGAFSTEEAAARAYDDAARQLHGEFARLNFPKDGEQSAVA